jgi:methionyl-tRNA synthetase
MPKSFYITTPIFYPNDRLHLGHAYTMVSTDIIVRYKKSQGYQVYFQTGSDEHGEKIEKKALFLNLLPRELVDQKELRKLNEPAYFFKVSKYYSQLIEYYQENPNFLLPANAKKELFSNFLKENIPDLCITRSDIK